MPPYFGAAWWSGLLTLGMVKLLCSFPVFAAGGVTIFVFTITLPLIYLRLRPKIVNANAS